MKKELTILERKTGLIDLIDSLVSDLLLFLDEEGRYKNRMINKMDRVEDLLGSFTSEITEPENIETCRRIIYLFRRPIINDYNRLRVRRLSPGDSVICIILKLLETVSGFEEDDRISELKEIFQGFYDNIRNRGKRYKLWCIEGTYSKFNEEGELGKLRAKEVRLYKIEHPELRSQEIIGEKDSWTPQNQTEINL